MVIRSLTLKHLVPGRLWSAAIFLPKGFNKSVNTIFLLVFINEVGRIPVSIFFPIYLIQEFQAPYLMIGIALTMSAASSAFFQMIGGLLADYLGYRKTMIVSITLRILTLSMLTVSSMVTISVYVLLALYIFTEALSGLFQTAASVTVADLVEPTRRVETFGIYHICVNIAFTIGAFVGGFPIAFTILFTTWLASMLVNAAIVLKAVPEGPSTILKRRFVPRSIFAAAGDRYLLGFGLVTLGAGLVANQMGPTLILYSTGVLGFTREQLGVLYTLNGVLVILLQYPVSRLVTRYSLSKLLAVASGFRALGFLLVAGPPTFYLLELVIVACTLGEMLQSPAASSYAVSLADDKNRGEYLGFHNWAWNSGMALSPFLGSILLVAFSHAAYYTWYIIFIIGAICSLAYVWLGNITKRRLPTLARIL